MTSSTHTLSIDACRLLDAGESDTLQSLHHRFRGAALSRFLGSLAPMLEATVIGASETDYEPSGASAALLVGSSSVAHLDKSHLAAHTYVDAHPASGLVSYRLAIELATCGVVRAGDVLAHACRFAGPDVVFVRLARAGFENGEMRLARLATDLPDVPGYRWIARTPEFNSTSGILMARACDGPVAAMWRKLLDELGV